MNLDSVHCFIEIVDGLFEDGKSIVVEYYLNHSPKWKKINVISNKSIDSIDKNDIHGCTRKSILDLNNQCTFNHLFELNFEFDRIKQEIKENISDDKSKDELNENNSDKIENKLNKNLINNDKFKKAELLEWPYFEFYVWSFDKWKRKQFIGFAFFNLPQQAGQHIEKLNILSLNSNQPKTKLKQFFLGYSFEPKDNLTNKDEWRIGLNSKVIGSLTIKFNMVICKHIPSTSIESEELDAIEEKISKVVIAFRDARRRMQTLLKDKENIRFN